MDEHLNAIITPHCPEAHLLRIAAGSQLLDAPAELAAALVPRRQ